MTKDKQAKRKNDSFINCLSVEFNEASFIGSRYSRERALTMGRLDIFKIQFNTAPFLAHCWWSISTCLMLETSKESERGREQENQPRPEM